MLTEGRRAAEEQGLSNIRWVGHGPKISRGTRSVQVGHVRSIVSLDQRTARGRGRLRHARARRLVSAHRAHGDRGRPRPPSQALHRSLTRRSGNWSPVTSDPIAAPVRALVPQGRTASRTCWSERASVSLRCNSFQAFRTSSATARASCRGTSAFAPSAPHLFPDGGEAFARDRRALLAERSPQGAFWDWPGDTEVVRARKDR